MQESRELYLRRGNSTMAPRLVRNPMSRRSAYLSGHRASRGAAPAPAQGRDGDGGNASNHPEKVKLVEGFGVGIRRDVKARLPFYKSDIKDGVSVKSVSLSSTSSSRA